MADAYPGKNGIFGRVTQSESPYSASGSDVCDLIVASAVGPGALARCVARLRGVEISLPNPVGCVLFVGGEDDTILTQRDYQYWKQHPLMRGMLCVIGTLGYRHTLIWDRRVVATNAAGQICVYDMGPVCFVSRVAQELVEFLAYGLPEEYIASQMDARGGVVDAASGALHAPSVSSSPPTSTASSDLSHPPDFCQSIIYSHWLPPSYTTERCAFVDFGSVIRVGVPSERLFRRIRLGEEDFNDELFKSAAVASAP